MKKTFEIAESYGIRDILLWIKFLKISDISRYLFDSDKNSSNFQSVHIFFTKFVLDSSES